MSERIKLVESFTIGPKAYKKVNSLNEKDQTISIKEKKTGKKIEYKAKAVYTFPISKPDKVNLNERIYTRKLWERVIDQQTAEGSYGLMDHPKDNGSTKDRWCVWRNLRLSEDKTLVLCDAYLFGKWGQEVLEGLEAGGKVGLSTSGFGEFKSDKKTIDESTYELERVADFVFNPSYEVFGKQSDAVEIEKEEDLFKEEIGKNKKENSIMNNKEKKLSSLEEKSFRLNILSSFKEAKKVEAIGERITLLEELLTYFEDGIAENLRKEIEAKLLEDVASFKEFASKGEKIDELIEKEKKTTNDELIQTTEEVKALEKKIEDLEEKYRNSIELLDSTKAYTNKLNELYDVAKAEKNGMVTPTEYKEALIFIEDLEAKKIELEKEIIVLRQQNEAKKEKDDNSKNKKKKTKKSDDEDDEDEDEKDKDEKKKTKKKEDYSNVNEEIKNYYIDLEYSNPTVIKIKEDIMRSKTLFEAQRTYLRLKGLLDDNSIYDRKIVSKKNTFAESSKMTSQRRKGWM